MNVRWLKHLPQGKEREEYKQRLWANRDIFKQMKSMLEEDLSNTIKSRRSLKSYFTQSWSEYQADRNATERTLQEIIDLLPIEED